VSKLSIVRKLLLPIDEYARVSEAGTLQDALRALADAQRYVRPTKQPHRAVLVERSTGVFVGLLGYKEILAALRPEQLSFELDETMRQAGVSDAMVSTSLASLQFFQEDLPSLGDRACAIEIQDLLLARPMTIDADAPLHLLLDAFVRAGAPSMLVTDNGDIVGVIRMSDLLDEVMRASLGEHGGGCGDSDGG